MMDPCRTPRRAGAIVYMLLPMLLISAATTAAEAQAWPSRTITAVVPLSAGNAIDVVARAVLEQVCGE